MRVFFQGCGLTTSHHQGPGPEELGSTGMKVPGVPALGWTSSLGINFPSLLGVSHVSTLSQAFKNNEEDNDNRK